MQAIQVGKGGVFEVANVPAPALEGPYDIVVQVKAVALNPVDTKIRASASPGKILGYDASGIVESAGEESPYKPGDAVLYAGAVARQGSNAQLQLVDSRLVARKPESLAWHEAAAIPLVGLTAWEMFVDKFRLRPGEDNSTEVLLVINGAGGVGTLAIALAATVFGIKRIIATASRPETVEWVKKHGATDVINHRSLLGPQLESLGVKPSLAFITYDTVTYVKQLIPHMRAFGHIGSIVETTSSLDDAESAQVVPIHDMGAFSRALSFHWEFMFAKAIHGYDIESQGKALATIVQLAAEGSLAPLVTVHRELSVANLTEMHALQASGKAYGKIAFTVPDTLA
ncbi:GroES-like protein [Auricularia subglabra TFB-10046 SS5]|nr:GroES-like protein [Auricularia subglabra TFB-10046 SS5]